MLDMEELIDEVEKEIKPVIEKLDILCQKNSQKVMDAFSHHQISERHFTSTTGYGYHDDGRDTIEKVYAEVLGAEDALVRNQFISGTHALTVSLFGLLRPGDIMLSVSGKPYDTLDEVIGLKENSSSLKSFGVLYEEIDLQDDDFQYEEIQKFLSTHSVKMLYVQRSKGYSTRKSIGIEKLAKLFSLVRKISSTTIIMVDNCYCELVEELTPTTVGADIMVGSLIKNLGAGIASGGAYVAGKSSLIELVAERLTVPGQGKEVGPSLGANKQFLQGLFFAPSVVCASLKTAVFTSCLLEKMGLTLEPRYNEERVDIVQNIVFGNPDLLIAYTQAIQSSSAIDAHVLPIPSPMPGYEDSIIMASGSFVQGSSIELSCDAPIREPYIAYQQGSLTYEYGKLAVIRAASKIKNMI